MVRLVAFDRDPIAGGWTVWVKRLVMDQDGPQEATRTIEADGASSFALPWRPGASLRPLDTCQTAERWRGRCKLYNPKGSDKERLYFGDRSGERPF